MDDFASVYVWQQYHARGFGYGALVGIAMSRNHQESEGFIAGANRQWLTYSTPGRTISPAPRAGRALPLRHRVTPGPFQRGLLTRRTRRSPSPVCGPHRPAPPDRATPGRR
ncbi:MAG: hypothetical protein ABI692_05925 [Terracoccus sp.]